MKILTHDPDEAGRLTLALLLALGLHGVLLFGVSANGWWLRDPYPFRFEVTILPPMTRSPVPDAPAPAPERLEPQPKPKSPTTQIAPLSVAPAPKSAPAATSLPAPDSSSASAHIAARPLVPPAPSGHAAPSIPKPPPRPQRSTIQSPTQSAPAVAKVTAPVNSIAPPARKAPASSIQTVGDGRKDRLPRPSTAAPAQSAKPALDMDSEMVVPTTRPAARSARSHRPAGTETRRGRLDSSDLLGQVAGLETAHQQRANAGIRSKRVSPTDTQSLEGFYIPAWVRKVEQIGEMNFPDVARKLELTTGPVLDVSIRADGSLQEVRVIRSSGNAELDQAARRIVRLGAPYAAFPPQLRQQYPVLHISRPWRFDPGGQVRAR